MSLLAFLAIPFSVGFVASEAISEPSAMQNGNLCQQGPIFIIGSGVSGLLAARSLKEFGCNVTVFEALDRIGGRTHTFSSGTFKGIEEGAHWVHGGVDNLPSSKLLSFFNITQVRVGGDSNWEGSRDLLKLFPAKSAEPLSPEQRDASFDLFLTASAALDSYIDDNYNESEAYLISLEKAWQGALGAINYTEYSQLLLRWHQRIVFEQDEGAPVSACNAGAEFMDDYTDFYRGGLHKAGWERHGDAFVKGGYSSLVNALASGLEIRLRTPVDKIIYSPDGVLLRSGEQQFSGVAALVTASIGALKTQLLSFQPELPEWKTAALHRLGMGNVAKIFLKLGKDVDDDRLGKYSSGWLAKDDQLLTFCVRSGFEHKGSRVLECFLGGDAALAAERMELPALKEKAAKELSVLLGNNANIIEDISITQWSNNSYIKGAWSYVPVGASSKDFDALAAPVNRLHFAGEGTCRMLYGNVHAAVVSGIRAAHTILGFGASPNASREITQRWPLFDEDLLHLCTQPPKNAWHRSSPKARLRVSRFAQSPNVYV